MKKNINIKIKIGLTVIVFFCLISSPILGNKLNIKTSEETTEEEIDEYDLLILAPKEFKRSLQPLVKHKNKMGVKTELHVLPDVYLAYTGVHDKAESIKMMIHHEYTHHNIAYVMLVGNFKKMPIRYIYNNDPCEGYPEPYFISELYYADVVDEFGNYSSWDTDGNGVYGEWNGQDGAQDKDIDLRPDVYVGRLACRNRIEVRTMVRKIIRYETKTYGAEWFNRIIAAAGDTYTNESKYPAIEGEENAERVLENMSNFTAVRLYTSDGSFSGQKDIIKALSKGAGFVYFDGHASPYVWGTNKPGGGHVDGFNLITMSFILNGYKLPVYVGSSCHNLQFDVNLGKLLDDPHSYIHSTYIPECWGWKLVRKFGGGCIASIGNTGLGYTKEDKPSGEGAGDYMDPEFFYLYNQSASDILGVLWGKTIDRYLDKYPIDWDEPEAMDSAIDAKTVQQYTLFGDPSLKIGGYPPT